jgi:hypothetical protein
MIIWTNERNGVEIRKRGLEETRNDRGQRRRKQYIFFLSDRLKPFAPCRRFAACKRFLNGVKRRHFGKITGSFSPTVPHFATRSARVDGDVEASGGESGNF